LHLGFNKINVIFDIEGILINESRLRVGKGGLPSLGVGVDAETIKTLKESEYIPYIPGSSIKGALRAYVERILRSEGQEVHDPWDWDSIEREKEEPCLVCRLFGNTYWSSHIYVFDAYPLTKPRLEVKTGVGIDRFLGGAKARVLYDEEYVAPGCRWNFKMKIFNVDLREDSEEARLVKSCLKALCAGLIQLGARKSTGMGLIKLLAKETRVNEWRVKELELCKVSEISLSEILEV